MLAAPLLSGLAIVLAVLALWRSPSPSEIADAVEEELRVTDDETPTTDAGPTLPADADVDTRAYRSYLLGRFHIDRRTGADLEESVEHLSRAIRLDPGYAPSHAALADAYILLSTYYALPPDEAFPPARRAALAALELDPHLSAAHASLGMVSSALEWDFDAAERSYRRALELDPANVTAHQWYGELLSVLGRHDEALAEARRAWELEPLSPIVNAALGQRLNAAGLHRDALRQLADTLELEPRFAWIHRERAYAFTHLGDADHALEERREEMRKRGIGNDELEALGRGLDADGMRGFWRWELDRLERAAPEAYVPALLLAEAWHGLGDVERALSSLEVAVSERGDHVLQLTTSPELRALARDPRAASLLDGVGLGHLTTTAPTPPRPRGSPRDPS